MTKGGAEALALALIAPELDGAPTGGTLYNARLLAALRALEIACERSSLPDAKAAIEGEVARVYLVDSLYMRALPELAGLRREGRIFLLVHYLPSLVRLGRVPQRDELDAVERAALDAADGFVVTSPFLARALEDLGVGGRPLCCIEPGAELTPSAEPRLRAPLHAVMLASVVGGKGVLPLLERLAERLRSDDALTLSIAGSLELEPGYAQACQELIARTPAFVACVRLLGALPHARALELLRSADLLLSASRMEAYGMALAEARAAAVPIVARRGGHSQAHVDPDAGGVLVADEAGVADALLELARDPARLLRHRARALTRVRSRAWSAAAAELAQFIDRAAQ